MNGYDCVCADCGHEQEGMASCQECQSFRMVLVSIAELHWGPNWRDAFKKDGPTVECL